MTAFVESWISKMNFSVTIVTFLGITLLSLNSACCLCNYVELVSESILHALEIIIDERCPPSTAVYSSSNQILRKGYSTGAYTGLDARWQLKGTDGKNSRLLRHLDVRDDEWQNVMFTVVCNFSDIPSTVQEVANGNPHWIYFIVFPSDDGEMSSRNFNHEINSLDYEKFAGGLSIANKVFVLFPQKLGVVDLNDDTKRGSACLRYPINGISMYMLKNRLITQEIVFHNSISLEDVLGVLKLRGDFQETVIKAVSFYKQGTWEHAMSIETGEDGVIRFTGGYEAEAVTYLAKALNFTLEALITDNFVGRDEYGNLTGMGKIVLDDEADIGISDAELLDWRKERLTFLQPTFLSRLQGFMLPPPRSASGNVFFLVFQLKTWEAFIGTFVGLAISATCCLKLKRHLAGDSATVRNDDAIGSESLIWATGAACQQGWYINPDSASLRIIFIIGYVVGLVCFIGYSATLVSIISNERQPLKSLKEWQELGWHFIPDQSTKALQHLETEERLTFMWNMPSELAMKRMLAGGHIILSSSEIFNPIVRDYFHDYNITACGKESDCGIQNDPAICRLVYGFPIDLPVVKSSMFLKKENPMAGFFQTKTILLLETGVQHRNVRRFFKEDAFYCAKTDSADLRRPMEMQDVYASFYVLCIGSALAFACVLAEIVFARAKIVNFESSWYFN